MVIDSSLAHYLRCRLVCVKYHEGKVVFGIFDDLSESHIVLREPYETSYGIKAEPKWHEKKAIKSIKVLDDLSVAYILKIGFKASKKARGIIEEIMG